MKSKVDIKISLAPFLSLELSRLFQGGVSIFLAGPSGVGKTSFKLVLKHVELKVLLDVETTAGDDSEIVYYQIHNSPTTISTWCYDFGGDKQYYEIWSGTIRKHLPLGMIYVLDHQNSKKTIYELLKERKLPITRHNLEKVLREERERLGRITEERVAEHKEYLAYLFEILRSDKRLQKRLQTFVVIVNKEDLWGKYCSMDDFKNRFMDDILKIQNIGFHVPQWIATSTYENTGIQKAMEELLRHAGREFRFFGIKFYWKKSFIE